MIRSAKHAMTVEGVGIRHTPGCSLGFACVGIADEVDTVSVDVFEDHRLRLAVGWGGGGSPPPLPPLPPPPYCGRKLDHYVVGGDKLVFESRVGAPSILRPS